MERIIITLWLIVAFLLPATVYGVPAKPTPFTQTLPDGSELTVFLRGDEHFHFYTSVDGYPLIEENDGYFYYAREDSDNRLKSSRIRARELGERSEAEKAFLTGVEKQQLLEILQRSREEQNPRFRSQSRTAAAGSYPSTGQQKALVILVEYQDIKFSVTDPTAEYTNMMNQAGYSNNGAIGSARDYYITNSNGAYLPDFDVYGPVTLSKSRSYYGGNDSYGNDMHPEEMVVEACALLDGVINFQDYDSDKDGFVDNIYIFYAGKGEADGGGASTVWPHAWYVYRGAGRTAIHDGKQIDRYACSNELNNTSGAVIDMDGIGTFCHEYAHVLGLPDLYATSYSGAFTPGAWELMDYGPYNGNGKVPPYMSAYCRYALGWLNPEVIEKIDTTYTLDPISANQAYMIKTSLSNEYFLLENRQQTAWDQFIPGHGMLIWHIDYNASVWSNNRVNNNPSHQYVDIEEADNIRTDNTRSGDCFPGTSNITRFNDTTNPNMKSWNSSSQYKPLSNIREISGVIRFRVGSEVVAPAVPAVLPAQAVSSAGFTACWQKSPSATGYELDVYSKNSNGDKLSLNYLPGYENCFVGDTANRIIGGLEPSSDYFYVVRAVNQNEISENSSEMLVTTLTGGFADLQVTALAADLIDEHSFRANWNHLPTADFYLLNLTRLETGESESGLYDFIGRPVGSDTTFVVTGLEAATDYLYSVQASAGGVLSKVSTSIPVKTLARPTSLTSVSGNMSVSASAGLLHVRTVKPVEVEVYNLLGGLIKQVEVNGEAKINLASGIYVIKSDQFKQKVMVP